LAPEVI
jgi:large subunit ribosomal protein L5